MTVPDSFDSIDEVIVFLSSLSAVDRTLLDAIVARSAETGSEVEADVRMPEYWSTATDLSSGLRSVGIIREYWRSARLVLLKSVDGAVRWDHFAHEAVANVVAATMLPATTEQWTIVLAPFRRLAAVPTEWRPVIVDAADNLGLDAALELPFSVES